MNLTQCGDCNVCWRGCGNKSSHYPLSDLAFFSLELFKPSKNPWVIHIYLELIRYRDFQVIFAQFRNSPITIHTRCSQDNSNRLGFRTNGIVRTQNLVKVGIERLSRWESRSCALLFSQDKVSSKLGPAWQGTEAIILEQCNSDKVVPMSIYSSPMQEVWWFQDEKQWNFMRFFGVKIRKCTDCQNTYLEIMIIK
jgi:hypothetical protein